VKPELPAEDGERQPRAYITGDEQCDLSRPGQRDEGDIEDSDGLGWGIWNRARRDTRARKEGNARRTVHDVGGKLP
jgi:hypothetical protein